MTHNHPVDACERARLLIRHSTFQTRDVGVLTSAGAAQRSEESTHSRVPLFNDEVRLAHRGVYRSPACTASQLRVNTNVSKPAVSSPPRIPSFEGAEPPLLSQLQVVVRGFI